MFRDIPNLVFF